MARRARKGVDTGLILGIGAGLIVLGAIGFFVMNRSNDPMKGVTPLSVSDYKQSSDSLQGNTYKLTGTVMEKLLWTPEHGQVVRIDVSDTNGSGSLGVLVPPEFNGMNINVGETFTMKVEVIEKGKLVALELVKS